MNTKHGITDDIGAQTIYSDVNTSHQYKGRNQWGGCAHPEKDHRRNLRTGRGGRAKCQECAPRKTGSGGTDARKPGAVGARRQVGGETEDMCTRIIRSSNMNKDADALQ